jgi:hypothetical protein
MRGLAGIYAQQFKVTMASFIQYRAALVIWLIGHVLEPLIYLVVWSTVSRSAGGSVGGFTAADFAAYFIVLMIVNHMTYTWIMYEYEYRVRQGTLSFDLLRPVHPIHSDIADNSPQLITLRDARHRRPMSLVFRPSSRGSWAWPLSFPWSARVPRSVCHGMDPLAAFWAAGQALNQISWPCFFSGRSRLELPSPSGCRLRSPSAGVGFPTSSSSAADTRPGLNGDMQLVWLAAGLV